MGAVSAQYSIQKLYNDPLLRVTISKVAASKPEEQKRAASVALALALVLGVAQALFFGARADVVIAGLGVVKRDSAILEYAVSYLSVRAWGAPVGSMLLALTGIYRGTGDTRTPLAWSLIATVINVLLDPLLIFGLGLGTGGAALATVLAQFTAVVGLLSRVEVERIALKELVGALTKYVATAGLMVTRNFGKVFAFAFVTRQAAQLGVVPAAAFALTFQIGFATSQLAEALATATQVTLAKELHSTGQRRVDFLKYVMSWGLRAGLGVSALLSVVTWLAREPLLRSLTSDAAVQAAASAVIPVVCVCQVFKAMAYPLNGSLMGGLDWTFLTAAMWVASLTCVSVARVLGAGSLQGIWCALVTFFAMQCALGLLRIRSGTGIWSCLRAA